MPEDPTSLPFREGGRPIPPVEGAWSQMEKKLEIRMPAAGAGDGSGADVAGRVGAPMGSDAGSASGFTGGEVVLRPWYGRIGVWARIGAAAVVAVVVMRLAFNAGGHANIEKPEVGGPTAAVASGGERTGGKVQATRQEVGGKGPATGQEQATGEKRTGGGDRAGGKDSVAGSGVAGHGAADEGAGSRVAGGWMPGGGSAGGRSNGGAVHGGQAAGGRVVVGQLAGGTAAGGRSNGGTEYGGRAAGGQSNGGQVAAVRVPGKVVAGGTVALVFMGPRLTIPVKAADSLLRLAAAKHLKGTVVLGGSRSSSRYRRIPRFSAGITFKQYLPLPNQQFNNYNTDGERYVYSDYVPAVFLRAAINHQSYLQASVGFHSPQYARQMIIDNENLRNSSVPGYAAYLEFDRISLKKLFYNELELTYHYEIADRWRVGAGIQYALFSGGTVVTQTILQPANAALADTIYSTRMEGIKHQTSLYGLADKKAEWRGIVEIEYCWTRWMLGMRYQQAVQSFGFSHLSGGQTTTNGALSFRASYALWERTRR